MKIPTKAKAILPLVFLLSECGYRPVYGGESPLRLHVALVRSLVPDAVASDEVARGVRDVLAREGALEGGDGWPRAEIEVLRVDETSDAVAVNAGAPVARATEVAIVARVWIRLAEGDPPRSDSGDMRASEVMATDRVDGVLSPVVAGFHDPDAVRAAARRLGEKLGYRLLGQPAASDDL